MNTYNIILSEKSYLIRLGVLQVLEELKIQASICECTNIKEIENKLHAMDVDVLLMGNGICEIPANKILHFKSIKTSLKIVRIKQCNEETPSYIDHFINLQDDKRMIFRQFESIFKSAERPKHEQEDAVLSKREIDILRLVAKGFTNSEIAEELFISAHTVISHRKNISRKLGIKSVAGLTVFAILNNYIDGSAMR